MSTRFEQISQSEIPSYTGEVATDIGFESVGEVTTTGSPNFPAKTEWESEPDPVTTVQRRRGAHLEVIDALSGITFVPGSACQMSQAIAYIRYWSRGGVQQKGVTQEENNYKPNDPAEVLGQSVSSLYTDPNIDFQTTRSVLYPLPNFSQRAFTGVPVNTFNPSLDLSTPSQTTPSTGSAISGSVYNANPGSNSLGYSYTDAVWMFLFNPEELQLSSGPDYNRAETWGVSDPNNSGQPLSWRANRNRKLSFGKVLLHGYTIGKRVDTLEAGLQQLFMARDGENGSDGPPVLEFVWGKRVFGPCVIQNIQVREKAWDKGILVNAEVSFELEQVPEWTINDGYVDVLRPGRQPLVNDPILPQGRYNQPEGNPDGNEPPASQPGGGNPKPTSKNNPTLCNTALVAGQNFQKVVNLSDKYTGLFKLPTRREFDQVAALYGNEYVKYLNVVETLAKPSLISKSPGCFRMNGNVNITMQDLVADTDYNRGVVFARGCAVEIKRTLDQWVAREAQGGKCDSLRKAREAAEEAEDKKKKAQEEKQKCKRFENEKINAKRFYAPPCSHSELGSQRTCLGKVYVCERYTGQPTGQGWVEQ